MIGKLCHEKCGKDPFQHSYKYIAGKVYKEIKPGESDQRGKNQRRDTDVSVLKENRGGCSKRRGSVPRGKRISSRRRYQQGYLRIGKGARSLHNGLDDAVIQNRYQYQGDQPIQTCFACFFKTEQTKGEDDPDHTAVAHGRESFHQQSEKRIDEVVLDRI